MFLLLNKLFDCSLLSASSFNYDIKTYFTILFKPMAGEKRCYILFVCIQTEKLNPVMMINENQPTRTTDNYSPPHHHLTITAHIHDYTSRDHHIAYSCVYRECCCTFRV